MTDIEEYNLFFKDHLNRKFINNSKLKNKIKNNRHLFHKNVNVSHESIYIYEKPIFGVHVTLQLKPFLGTFIADKEYSQGRYNVNSRVSCSFKKEYSGYFFELVQSGYDSVIIELKSFQDFLEHKREDYIFYDIPEEYIRMSYQKHLNFEHTYYDRKKIYSFEKVKLTYKNTPFYFYGEKVSNNFVKNIFLGEDYDPYDDSFYVSPIEKEEKYQDNYLKNWEKEHEMDIFFYEPIKEIDSPFEEIINLSKFSLKDHLKDHIG